MAVSIKDLKEEDYADKWVKSVNEKDEQVHENEVLGIKVTIHSTIKHEPKRDAMQTDQL